MDDLLVREQAADQHVHELLTDTSQPILSVLQAFAEYRQLSQACIFADFQHADKREARLWVVHTQGRRYFNSALKDLRKKETPLPVETRYLVKHYLTFIKDSVRFYREFIDKLNATFGGIPELDAVAHKVKGDGASESSAVYTSPAFREKALQSCHRILIYLGDLSRYRASEKLDKTPDFGPAIGYYDLACTIRPSSGMGQHQQAVVALEQRRHLPAIYHLYRALVVDDPHPLASNNLKLEFEKCMSLWKKGELIEKSQPNDPEAPKRALVGWSVLLHSTCAQGENFKGFDELEREIMNHLAAVVKQPISDSTLLRMVMVNLAAQYNAIELFQANPDVKNQQAFYYFLHFNLRTYTTLLRSFHDNLAASESATFDDDDLASRLNESARQVLPPLRVYTAWLTADLHIVVGLAGDEFLKGAIDELWQAFSNAVNKVQDVFDVWSLDEVPEIRYMHHEDAETLGFKPLQHEKQKVWRNWQEKTTGILKPRFSDRDVTQLSESEEMLGRVKDFLNDGMFLAQDVDEAPIALVGSRVYFGEAIAIAQAKAAEDAEQARQQPPKPVDKPTPKPLSYAAAAAAARPSVRDHVKDTASTISSGTQHARISRMIEDLVDEDDGNNPVTPPQQHASTPAVVTNGDFPHGSVHFRGLTDFENVPSHQPKMPSSKPLLSARPTTQKALPQFRTPRETLTANSKERFESVSSLWNNSSEQGMAISPDFPAGLPTGTLSSPVQVVQGHSRVNSAGSARSRTSQNVADSWSSLGSNAGVQHETTLNGGLPANVMSNFSVSSKASPLLFGVGGGIWSTRTEGPRNSSPPNGQGG